MNKIDLAGRAAVVTGGARGIGYAVAERVLGSGGGVAIWDRDQARMKSAAAALGKLGKVTTAMVDVADPKAIEAATEATVKAHGKIDILVNNAGIAGTNAKVWETTIEEWRRVIDIDLTGVFLCCRAVAPRMVANGYGRIVNIASIAGKEGNPNAAHYSSAKAGVIALTKALGKELVGTGVLCNAIAPAMIETEILEQVSEQFKKYMVEKIPLGRAGRAEEVAALVAWLASEDCSFSTGAVYDISGGRATY